MPGHYRRGNTPFFQVWYPIFDMLADAGVVGEPLYMVQQKGGGSVSGSRIISLPAAMSVPASTTCSARRMYFSPILGQVISCRTQKHFFSELPHPLGMIQQVENDFTQRCRIVKAEKPSAVFRQQFRGMPVRRGNNRGPGTDGIR